MILLNKKNTLNEKYIKVILKLKKLYNFFKLILLIELLF